jgi:hypothetical protein
MESEREDKSSMYVLMYNCKEMGIVLEELSVSGKEEYQSAVEKAKQLDGELYRQVDEKTDGEIGSPFYLLRYINDDVPLNEEIELRHSLDVKRKLEEIESFSGKLYQKVFPFYGMERCFSARDRTKRLREWSERSSQLPGRVGQSEPRY